MRLTRFLSAAPNGAKMINNAGVTKKTLIPSGFGVMSAEVSERFTPSSKYAHRLV